MTGLERKEIKSEPSETEKNVFRTVNMAESYATVTSKRNTEQVRGRKNS